MNDKNKAVPEWNPETGDVEVPEAPLLSIDGTPVRKAMGRAGNGYSFYVPTENGKVYFKHIERDKVNEVLKIDRDFKAATDEIQAKEKAKKLTDEAANAASVKACFAREDAMRAFVRQYVFAWEFKDGNGYWPCTAENVDELEFGDVAAIITGITQQKLAGKVAGDFLANK